MKEPPYPLEQVLQVKKDRVKKAEKVVQEKKDALEKEKKTLKRVEKERDEVKQHHDDKLEQLRQELDQSSTTDKIRAMKRYLKLVKEDLAKEEKKVEEQQQEVSKAEQALEEARAFLLRKRMEAEKLELHRKEWRIEMLRELAREEGKQMDEIGTVIHQSQTWRQKRS